MPQLVNALFQLQKLKNVVNSGKFPSFVIPVFEIELKKERKEQKKKKEKRKKENQKREMRNEEKEGGWKRRKNEPCQLESQLECDKSFLLWNNSKHTFLEKKDDKSTEQKKEKRERKKSLRQK